MTQPTQYSYEDAKEAVWIAVAQCPSPHIRKRSKEIIMGFIDQQQAKLDKLEKYAKNWGFNQQSDHIEALAKYWDDPR